MQTEATNRMKGKFLTVGKHRMHYLDEGSGETILFVHGIPEWSMTYQSVVNVLSKSFRCIVPDHLGFGFSDKDIHADLSPKAHSERLLEFIRQLDLTDIHLVVHDLGGPIGLGAFVLEPKRFKRLIVSNTWLWSLEGTPGAKVLKLFSGAVGRWLYLNYGFSVKVMAKNGFASKKVYNEWYSVLMAQHRDKTERFANYRLMLEMLLSGQYFEDTRKALHNINIPAQLLWGSKDTFFNKKDFLSRWQREFPAYSVAEIQQAGHFPHMETPAEYAEAIARFATK